MQEAQSSPQRVPFGRRAWTKVWRAGETAYEQFSQGTVDEQAGPAYFRGLWLSRRLFRQRLKLALSSVPAGDRCLDFGCGFGLALPYLANKFKAVTAVDSVTAPLQEFMAVYDASPSEQALKNIDTYECLTPLIENDLRFDAIVALDVLEHIEALPELLHRLKSLLAPGGTLVVSGPTENHWYRLGRKMVGFSGDYHVTDIYEIEKQLQKLFRVERIARIPKWPALFQLLHATHDQ